MMQDIRWQQRFNNLKKAFSQLEKAVDLEDYSDLEREGLIQRFEYTFELAWNTIKDYLEEQGYRDITGSKDAIKQAFQSGIIKDGELWMNMINSRILTSHTYNEETAVEIAGKIKEEYFGQFQELINRFEEEINKKSGDLLNNRS